jgi:hypothetical protein
VEFAIVRPVNRERPAAMIEVHHVFRFDVIHVAGFNPAVAHGFAFEFS